MSDAIPRLLVLTGDHGLPDATKRGGRYNEEDLATHAAMCAAMAGLPGLDLSFLTAHAALLDRLRNDPPDLIVNFCDTGFRNMATRELHVPALFELFDVPYTGATPACIAICYDKEIVRLLAQAHGVPVPRETYVAAERPLDDLPELFPALIKPNQADGSVGITKDAVVHDAAEARAYLSWMRRELPGRAALIQEYLPGAEYGVALIGNPEDDLTALPLLEVDYSRLPKGLNPILSYESKALPDSPYWTEINFKTAEVQPHLRDAMVAQAKLMFRRLGCRDYARFDFRTGADGVPKLLEVNPNPAWANDGKLAFMAGFAGLSYPELLGKIVEAALRRIRRA